MLGYQLPASLNKDIEHLEDLINRAKKKEISLEELKPHRVSFGVYEQREKGTYMLRIRCAAGIIRPEQLEKVAGLSIKYGNGQLHITTRGELQLHYVKLEDIITIARQLQSIGLSSRGGGGNTVRNIVAPEDAGIDPEEVFDVTGFNLALTERFIAEEDSWTMPRKFKVAFSGSGADKAYASLADLGFIAHIKDGKEGFRVYIAGGLGTKPAIGNLLFDFIPADQVYPVAKAAKQLFWKYGNRRNKHAARLRFLYNSLGEEEFKQRFNQELEEVKKSQNPILAIHRIENNSSLTALAKTDPADAKDFLLWKNRFAREQKQKGLYSILIGVEMGFLSAQKTEKLASFIKSFGENTIRMNKEQNFILRNIPEASLAVVYNFLANNLDNFNRPLILDRIISCAGASTCQLGICLSRGVTKEIIRRLSTAKLDLDKFSNFKINISGCPNSCGQHQAADLGFFGKASRKDGQLYPAYNVVADADITDGKAKLAEFVGEVSARDLPVLVVDFLEGKGTLKEVCERYKDIPSFDKDKSYYLDWGQTEQFSLAGRGTGECSAGIFDLIDMDLAQIKKIKSTFSTFNLKLKEKALAELVFYSSRMLLISRGVEAATEKDVYSEFTRHFISTGLVSDSLKDLLQLALAKDYPGLLKSENRVLELADRVDFLYEHMDNAFNFKIPETEISSSDKTKIPVLVKDLRGVTCPMNFVKTKMELAKIKSGEILEIWLDDGPPIENVPGSVMGEGHKILKQAKIEDYWLVVIEKV